MARPTHRKPPRLGANDGLLLDYDFAPRYGWGTYPARGYRGDSLMVWEERGNLGNNHPMLSRISTDSLESLVTVGRALGME